MSCLPRKAQEPTFSSQLQKTSDLQTKTIELPTKLADLRWRVTEKLTNYSQPKFPTHKTVNHSKVITTESMFSGVLQKAIGINPQNDAT